MLIPTPAFELDPNLLDELRDPERTVHARSPVFDDATWCGMLDEERTVARVSAFELASTQEAPSLATPPARRAGFAAIALALLVGAMLTCGEAWLVFLGVHRALQHIS